MKNKKIILILFLFFFGLAWFITPTRAATKTKTIYPTRDTYTDTDFPNTNYGGDWYLYAGDWWGGDCRSYIQFSKSELPSEILEVHLRIDIYYISGSMWVDIYTTDEWWDEYSVDLYDYPTSYYWDDFYRSAAGLWTITLTGIDLSAEFPSGDYMTFILRSDSSAYLEFGSRENTLLGSPALLIDYTAKEEAGFPVLLLVGIIIGVSAAIATAAIVTIILVKKKKGRIEPIVEPVQKITEIKEQPVLEEKFCFICGSKVSGKFCTKCGTEVPL